MHVYLLTDQDVLGTRSRSTLDYRALQVGVLMWGHRGMTKGVHVFIILH